VLLFVYNVFMSEHKVNLVSMYSSEVLSGPGNRVAIRAIEL